MVNNSKPNRIVAVLIIISLLAMCIVTAKENTDFINVQKQYQFNEFSTLPDYVSGKNMKLQSDIVLDSDGEGGKNILAKYWGPFCYVSFRELFDGCTILNGAEFIVTCDVRVNIDSPLNGGNVYMMLLDENGNSVYNYSDADAAMGSFVSKTKWVKLTLHYTYKQGKLPKSVAILSNDELDLNNKLLLNIDNVAVEQITVGSEAADEMITDYAAAYGFESETNFPSYIVSRHLKPGSTMMLDENNNHSSSGVGKSILAKYWANYNSVLIQGMFQTAGVQPGEKYKIVAFAKIADQSYVENANMFFGVLNNETDAQSGSIIYRDKTNAKNITKDTWTMLETEYVIPDDTSPVCFGIYTDSTEASSTNFLEVNFDDFYLISMDASDEKTVKDERLNMLQMLNVTPSFVEKYIPESVMTRGDFANLLMSFYPGLTETHVSPNFSDINQTNSNYFAVGFLSQLGIMGGYPDNTFRPDEKIVYGEILKSLLSLVGYDYIAKYEGGYPIGYLGIADRLNLTKGIKKSVYSTVSHKDILALLCNFINCPVNHIVSNGDSISFKSSNDRTVLSEIFSIRKKNGIIKGTYKTLLSGESNLAENQVLFGDELLICKNVDILNYANESIGYYTTYYYKDLDGMDMELLYFMIGENKNNVVVIPADMNPRYENNMVYYDDGDKNRKIEIDFTADIIFNGKCYDGAENIFDIQEGKITFIDADTEDGFETIVIEKIDYYVLSRVDQKNEIIYTKFDDQRIDIGSTNRIVTIHNKGGRAYSVDALKDGDVLAVKRSWGDSNVVLDIEVSSKSFAGVITEYSKDEKTINVDSKVFKLTSKYLDLCDKQLIPLPTIGTNMIFYLNNNNHVVAAEISNANYRYGYVIDYGVTPGLEFNAEIKLLTAQNQIITFSLEKTITLNETQRIKAKDISLSQVLFSENKIITQVIGYKLNSSGKISNMLTPEKTNNIENGKICCVAENVTDTYRNGGYFGKGKYNITQNSIVFRAPADKTKGEDYFEAFGKSYFIEGLGYTFSAYATTGIYNNINIIVINNKNILRGTKSISAATKMMLIERVTTSLAKDGEEGIMLYGYLGDTKAQILVKDYRIEKSPELSVGDVIIYSANTDGEVVLSNNGTGSITDGFVYILDANGNNGMPKTIVNFTSNTNSTYTNLYRVQAVKNGYAICNETNHLGQTITDAAFPVMSMLVYVYDEQRGNFIRGNIGNIKDYENYGENCSHVLVHVRQQTPYMMVVY